jgi:hypothetical protein
MSNEITQQTPITTAKAAANYGIIFGIIMILEFVIAYVADIQPQENKWAGIINGILNNLVLPILFIVLACKHFKKANGGYITLGQSIKTGVATTVIAAVLFSIFNIIFNVIFPEFQADALEKMKQAQLMANPNMTAEQMKLALKMSEIFLKPYVAFPMAILFYAFIGLIYALIVGAIVKKENPFGDAPKEINNIGGE